MQLSEKVSHVEMVILLKAGEMSRLLLWARLEDEKRLKKEKGCEGGELLSEEEIKNVIEKDEDLAGLSSWVFLDVGETSSDWEDHLEPIEFGG